MVAIGFEFRHVDVRDFEIDFKRKQAGDFSIDRVKIDGEKLAPTKRFWKSFFSRFGITEKVFRYFDPVEVFERISLMAPNQRIRCCIERPNNKTPNLLAVTTPGRPLIRYEEVLDTVSRYYGEQVTYEKGIVSSTHVPRSGKSQFQIGGDEFEHRFVMETPIDGFGHPKVHLSFLRLVCQNGMVGYSRAFRSDISVGKDISHCITRALDSFDNGDGYSALRQRFQSAQSSWASIHECLELYKTLTRTEIQYRSDERKIHQNFQSMTGNLHSLYGLANLDALSSKRQRILPAKCRVYDLLNFASEVGSHYATSDGNRRLQAFIGSRISDEYDLEGTAEEAVEFNDLFIENENAVNERTTDPFSVN